MNNMQNIFDNLRIIGICREQNQLKFLFYFEYFVLIFRLITVLLSVILILTPRCNLYGSKIVFNVIGLDPIDKNTQYEVNFEYFVTNFSAEIIDDFVEKLHKYLEENNIPYTILDIHHIDVTVYFNKTPI
jgi:hypothetical protein